MQEAIEQGGGERAVVVEDLRPALVDAVGCDDRAAVLIAATDDLEEQIGAGFIDRQIAELVNQYEVALGISPNIRALQRCSFLSREVSKHTHPRLRYLRPQASADFYAASVFSNKATSSCWLRVSVFANISASRLRQVP
jgi:hypothetical protein